MVTWFVVGLIILIIYLYLKNDTEKAKNFSHEKTIRDLETKVRTENLERIASSGETTNSSSRGNTDAVDIAKLILMRNRVLEFLEQNSFNVTVDRNSDIDIYDSLSPGGTEDMGGRIRTKGTLLNFETTFNKGTSKSTLKLHMDYDGSANFYLFFETTDNNEKIEMKYRSLIRYMNNWHNQAIYE
ncbi:hypothetical protein [Kaistella antarctica]|uniref:Uncharacterized protein n=1 Tax=Kaistella antarctica TaxID=266748 RepID=A0A448NSU3_9FLAO|nr:hypothetical protein [Kaistella antarctica]KEY17964.1 hypothetical protein HY04_05395 [Kaistella antarctica]SEV81684.1 hypothetical protein SAMN05421765_0279 [Kaistella antarctica]VEI00398.1 Uncharacterised protein [Kaistella antarctica]